MNRKLLDKFKSNPRSSFAFWDEQDCKQSKNASGMQWVKKKKFSEYKENIIFVGMNLADYSPESEPFKNYHSTCFMHNDYLLRDAIVGTAFEGAYMTDLFQRPCGNSKELKQYYDSHQEELGKDIDDFVKECREITSEEKIIIFIGKGFHCECFKKYAKLNADRLNDFRFMFKNTNELYSIPHHSPANRCHYKNDEGYITSVRKSLNCIQNEI